MTFGSLKLCDEKRMRVTELPTQFVWKSPQ
jgi:hypothetical protein